MLQDVTHPGETPLLSTSSGEPMALESWAGELASRALAHGLTLPLHQACAQWYGPEVMNFVVSASAQQLPLSWSPQPEPFPSCSQTANPQGAPAAHWEGG